METHLLTETSVSVLGKKEPNGKLAGLINRPIATASNSVITKTLETNRRTDRHQTAALRLSTVDKASVIVYSPILHNRQNFSEYEYGIVGQYAAK